MATATATEALPPVAVAGDRWRPSTQGWLARVLVLAVIFGGVLWVTAIVPGYWADRLALAGIYAIIGLSLNVVLGYVGQVSLGHHAFVGIAAFVAAYYATEKAGCSVLEGCGLSAFATAVIIGALSGAVAAGLLGLVALRISGLYLALITLAYGFVAEQSIFEIPFLTGAGGGMPAPRPRGFTTDTKYAFLVYAFLAVILFVDWSLMRSKVGRAILSIKHSEPVAASYGINVTAYKVLAFTMSGLFAGMAGSLFAFHAQNVVAANFNFTFALIWVLMVVVGGLGNRVGVVIGSVFFALFAFLLELIGPLERFFTETVARPLGNFTIVVGSLLAILTIVQFPGGIAEQISPITRWLRGQRFSLHPEGHGGSHAAAAGPGMKEGLMAKLGLHKTAPPEAGAETTEMATIAEGEAKTSQQPGTQPDAGAIQPADEPVAHANEAGADPSVADGAPVPEVQEGATPARPRKRGFLGKLGLRRSAPDGTPAETTSEEEDSE